MGSLELHTQSEHPLIEEFTVSRIWHSETFAASPDESNREHDLEDLSSPDVFSHYRPWSDEPGVDQ